MTIDVFEQPTLVICHPERSCTGFGYMLASPVFLFWPNRYRMPMSLMAKLKDEPQKTLRTPRVDVSKNLIRRGTISSFCSACPRRPKPPKPQL